MDSTTWMIVLGLVVGVVGGYFIMRKSNEFEAVRGGPIAEVVHYAVSAVMAALPTAFWFTVVVSLITPDNLFGNFVKFALVGLGVILVALGVYTVVEPDPTPEENALPAPD